MSKEIRFYIKDIKSQRQTPIFLKYQCGKDDVLKYSTGKKLNCVEWEQYNDPNMNDMQRKRKFPAVYNQLDKLSRYVKNYVELNPDCTSVELRNELRKKENKTLKAVVKENLFFSQIRFLIAQADSGEQTLYRGKRAGERYDAATLKHWTLAYNKLYEFNPNLTWDISIETYNKFVAWANKKGFRKNYTGTIIKIWKVFMTLGLSKKWHTNLTHMDPQFIKLKTEVEKVYLNETEIQSLIDLNLEGRDKIIRDLFVVGLFTGLRISDLKRLTLENYKGGKITIINRKTKKETAIPASKDVRRIIEEYNGFPKFSSEPVMNRAIKRFGREAKITEIVEFNEIVGGKNETTKIEKCELLGTHTCRRSFITNTLKRKIPIVDVAKFAGSNVNNVERYNKEKAEETAERYIGTGFFE
jgi:integrase